MGSMTGLDRLLDEPQQQDLLRGRIGYLCHAASVTSKLEHGLDRLVEIAGKRVTCAFGPQHGFTTDLQDNMIETGHALHPVHKIPIFSLYEKQRRPSDEMLDLIDTLVIDLQDVGTRVYTYIWTMLLAMEACARRGIRVLITDRPNPAGGVIREGTLAEQDWFSFVGMAPIPMRHGLTIGEMALFFKKTRHLDLDLEVISMKNWRREMLWRDTGLHWINPSPNLPTPEGALVYPGSVMFEGTVLSEGRGTTRSLEIFGHPAIEPFGMEATLQDYLSQHRLKGFKLRPLTFVPTCHKHAGEVCGGFQIHVTDPASFRPWMTVLTIIRHLYHESPIRPFWSSQPYEYQYERLAFDWINGSDSLRRWVEKDTASLTEITDAENNSLTSFGYLAEDCLLYH